MMCEHKQKINKCPVCEGRGIVPGGFYSSLPGCAAATASVSEYCRTCNGRGVLPTVEVYGNSVTYPNGFPPEKIILEPQTPESLLMKQLIEVRAELAAANARVAKLEKDNARQKRLATISRLCKNVQSFRAEKAEEKIKQMQDAIEFDFERFMEFQRRAEQAEAQCKRMQIAINRYVIGNIELLDELKAALEERK